MQLTSLYKQFVPVTSEVEAIHTTKCAFSQRFYMQMKLLKYAFSFYNYIFIISCLNPIKIINTNAYNE